MVNRTPMRAGEVTLERPNFTVPKLLYARREACFALSISLRKLDLLLAAGAIESIRIDGRVLIRAAVLTQFARTGTSSTLATRNAKSQHYGFTELTTAK